jgi:hypothetical protein
MAASSCISKPAPASKLPYRAHPNFVPSFHERPSGRHSLLQTTNILLIYCIFIFVPQQPSTTFNMLVNTLTVLGFAALAVAGKHCSVLYHQYI